MIFICSSNILFPNSKALEYTLIVTIFKDITAFLSLTDINVDEDLTDFPQLEA